MKNQEGRTGPRIPILNSSFSILHSLWIYSTIPAGKHL